MGLPKQKLGLKELIDTSEAYNSIDLDSRYIEKHSGL
jgi:hypothetical protein